MIVKLYKIIENDNNNYIYYYMINNTKNLYRKTMKLIIAEFYLKYKNIKVIYIRNIKVNYLGKILVDNKFYVSAFEYFDIYV